MKGAILILVVMLVFSLAFSQQEEGTGEADSTKADTSEVDTVEVDTLTADTTVVDTLQADTLEVDTLTTDTTEVDTSQADTLKTETPGADTLQVDSLEVDTVKAEVPPTDTLENDTLKAETPEPDTLEVDSLKAEIPGADTLRVDSLEVDSLKAGPPGVDTLMADTLQADTTVEETPKVVVHSFIGTKTCGMCHNSERKGRIYEAWDSTKHATAYATLANEQSRAIAEEMGIEDAQQDSTCLKCHVTGYGLPATDKYSVEEGVTCEACHGPGEHYDDIRVMTKPDLYEQNGMIVPDEELCVTCHNEESPTYKEFKYKDAYKLIEHRTPEREE
ncbi:MAG: cytochrome c family protein [Candidatus Zixiibacteriota bacterium]